VDVKYDCLTVKMLVHLDVNVVADDVNVVADDVNVVADSDRQFDRTDTGAAGGRSNNQKAHSEPARTDDLAANRATSAKNSSK